MSKSYSEFSSTNWAELFSADFVARADAMADSAYKIGKTVYPPRDQVFRALALTPPSSVRVVIIGQDPYHKFGQANGLAFSVDRGVPFPPSLRNIFFELSSDIGCNTPKTGDLSGWARQGVLLLNTSLTVADNEPNTPEFVCWHAITQGIIHATMSFPQPIVYLLWGKFAYLLVTALYGEKTRENKKFLCSTHPSPLSARRGTNQLPAFIGSRPFSQTNEFLQQNGSKPIDWAALR